MAFKSVAFGNSANNRSKARVMRVGYVGKQMMLDLMVQAAGKPAGEARVGGEVCSRANLVAGPIISFADATEIHSGREVRDLEYDRQRPTEDEVKQDESGYCP